jgi:hypothetical protein
VSSSISATPCAAHSATSRRCSASGIALPVGLDSVGLTTTARMVGAGAGEGAGADTGPGDSRASPAAAGGTGQPPDNANSSAATAKPVRGSAGISTARSPRLSITCSRPK